MPNSASTACRALSPGDGNQSPIQVELLQYGAGGMPVNALALIICSLLKERSIPPQKATGHMRGRLLNWRRGQDWLAGASPILGCSRGAAANQGRNGSCGSSRFFLPAPIVKRACHGHQQEKTVVTIVTTVAALLGGEDKNKFLFSSLFRWLAINHLQTS